MRVIIALLFFSLLIFSCNNNNTNSASDSKAIELKRGEIISCGPPNSAVFGTVLFNATIPADLQSDFNTAIALLHSFEYDEAEKMFAKICLTTCTKHRGANRVFLAIRAQCAFSARV